MPSGTVISTFMTLFRFNFFDNIKYLILGKAYFYTLKILHNIFYTT